MTHTYKIEGMTCNHCVARVKNALLKVSGVNDVSVQLPSTATIIFDKPISQADLQEALNNAGAYSITDAGLKSDIQNSNDVSV